MDVVARECDFVTGRSEAERRRRRLLGAHRVRGVPGHAGRGRSTAGAPDAGRAPGRRRRRRQGRPPAGRAPARGRRRRRRHRREPGGDRPAARRRTRRWTSSTAPRSSSPPTSTSTRPAPSAARSTPEVVATAASRRSSAARRTTSSPRTTAAARWPTCSSTAGSSTAPDYLVNAGGVIQVADELAWLRLRAGAGAGRADLRHHRRGAARWPTASTCRRRWPPTGSPSAHRPGRRRCGARGCPAGVESPAERRRRRRSVRCCTIGRGMDQRVAGTRAHKVPLRYERAHRSRGRFAPPRADV